MPASRSTQSSSHSPCAASSTKKTRPPGARRPLTTPQNGSKRPAGTWDRKKPKEDHVVVVRRLHGEGIGHSIFDARLPHLGSIELKHLGRGIGHDELPGVLGQEAGPLARAGGQLNDAAARLERPQRVADAIGGLGKRVVRRR